MNSFARFEELLDEQDYTVRAAIAQVNKESDKATVFFDIGSFSSLTNEAERIVNNADLMIFQCSHTTQS